MGLLHWVPTRYPWYPCRGFTALFVGTHTLFTHQSPTSMFVGVGVQVISESMFATGTNCSEVNKLRKHSVARLPHRMRLLWMGMPSSFKLSSEIFFLFRSFISRLLILRLPVVRLRVVTDGSEFVVSLFSGLIVYISTLIPLLLLRRAMVILQVPEFRATTFCLLQVPRISRLEAFPWKMNGLDFIFKILHFAVFQIALVRFEGGHVFLWLSLRGNIVLSNIS